ncbi:MAG: hypothetical protein PHH01_03280 [Patescibacteria group bacterium]|nr:hypothetical protein [Patescibacteria group bacterium]
MKGFRIIIIIIGVLVVLSAIILVVTRFTGSSKNDNANTGNTNNDQVTNNTAPANNNTNQTVNSNNANTNSGNNTNKNTNTAPVTPTGEASLKATARSFAERFGTFSNYSDYENVEHLLPYMTQRMKKWANKYIEEQRAKPPYTGIYSGTTTKALSVKTSSFEEAAGTAEFLVSTQRKESTGTTSNARIYYQDIKIKFVKEQSVWKVDEAWWQ